MAFRNFTLGQHGDRYNERLRTTVTNVNGLPELNTPAGNVTTQLTHVVYTRDSSGLAKIYVDSVEVASTTVGGNFSNWAPTYQFGLANELTSDRPWLGEFQLVAIYERALTQSEVSQNFNAGPHGNGQTVTTYTLTVSTSGAGAVALSPPGGIYDSGTVVTITATPADSSNFIGWSGALTGSANPVNITMDSDKNVIATFTGNNIVFPGQQWVSKDPAELGLESAKLDSFANSVSGAGIIIKDGYKVKEWGNPAAKFEWASAGKPVITNMLLFAVEEGRLSGVDDRIVDQGWNLNPSDTTMTFRHLADMISGYARGEDPGEAWAYNDYAIQLYIKTLVDSVFSDHPDLNSVVTDNYRLGALQFEDGSIFSTRGGNGMYTSPRDFARIGWVWLNKGNWNGTQILPKSYFDNYMQADVPANLPRTMIAGTDYLGVGTYGGGSDQTPFGAGIYGFNWWFNPNQQTWPDAPASTFQANGHWNGEVLTVFPSLGMVAAWQDDVGDPDSFPTPMNDLLKILVDAASTPPGQTLWSTVNSNIYTLDEVMIDLDGGSWTPDTSFALSAFGKIKTKEVVVDANWSDFVFAEDYKLMSLEELAHEIKRLKHLPGIPSAQEVEANGIMAGEMHARFLQKIEELTLYIIQFKKRNQRIRQRILSVERTRYNNK